MTTANIVIGLVLLLIVWKLFWKTMKVIVFLAIIGAGYYYLVQLHYLNLIISYMHFR
jgi:hypothetical protein